MEFKTSINCGGCVAKVTPFLNKLAGEGNWSVDTDSPSKVLKLNKEGVSSGDVIAGLDQLGYHAEVI